MGLWAGIDLGIYAYRGHSTAPHVDVTVTDEYSRIID